MTNEPIENTIARLVQKLEGQVWVRCKRCMAEWNRLYPNGLCPACDWQQTKAAKLPTLQKRDRLQEILGEFDSED